MTIRQLDLKILWGRSGNRCAICRCELAFDPKYASEPVPLGEQAHIVAKEPDGSRGNSILTSEERDRYDNLILLCPTHHALIDKVPKDYPVEKLHLLKTDHEFWVHSRLSEDGQEDLDVAAMVYASLLDTLVEKCQLENWTQWASQAIELEPIWNGRILNGIRDFEIRVLSAVWPGKYLELERSLTTLALVLREARNTFLQHAEHEDEDWRGPKFYKELRVWDTALYNQKFKAWKQWQAKCQALVFEATRAVNWVADCVRNSINPTFLVVEGRFRLIPSFRSDIPGDLWVVEYTPDQRQDLPKSLSLRISGYWELFPFSLSDDD